MPPSVTAGLAVGGYFTAMGLGYWVISRLVCFVTLWSPELDGCRICRLLGQIPYGPPYWLLRAHLRRAGRTEFADEQEVIS